MSVQHPGDLGAIVKDAVGWGLGQDLHPKTLGKTRQMKGDGAHALFRQKGANAMLQMRDDVEHRWCTMGIASIVGGVPVEELCKLGMPQLPSVELGHGPEKGQLPNSGEQPPRGTCAVGGTLVQATFQKHPACQIKGVLASLEVVHHRLGLHAPTLLHVGRHPLGVRPSDERFLFVFPKIMGASVQGFVPKRSWSSGKVLGHECIQFFHQFRHGEEGRASVEAVASLHMLCKLSAHFV